MKNLFLEDQKKRLKKYRVINRRNGYAIFDTKENRIVSPKIFDDDDLRFFDSERNFFIKNDINSDIQKIAKFKKPVFKYKRDSFGRILRDNKGRILKEVVK